MTWQASSKRVLTMSPKSHRSAFQEHLFLFKLAMVFLTRLPVKITAPVNDKDINAASGYFPLVGLVIAALVSAILVGFSYVLPMQIAVLLSMVASLFITGVFHEDGLADTADGFGGGWSAQQKLHIMKDSRLGTYGTSALFMALMLKYHTLVILAEFSVQFAVVSLVFAHMISRVFALSIIPSSEYADISSNELSQELNKEEPQTPQPKTKPVAQSLSEQSISLLYLFTGLAVLLLLLFTDVSVWSALLLFAGLWLIRGLLIRFYHQQISGYNGDVLGATQQVIELCCYLGLVIWSFV